jgi:methyltransferase
MTAPFIAFVAVLAVVGLLRLGEVAVSRRRWLASGDGPVAEPVLFPVMALLHLGLVVAPVLEVWVLDRPFRPGVALGAALVLLGATVLRVWTLRTIGRSWNVRIVRPAPGGIATDGPYRWIRHPNYLAVILEIAALPLLHWAWMSCLGLSLLNAWVLRRRIEAEETVLETIPEWRDAMADVPRLVPGPTRSRAS